MMSNVHRPLNVGSLFTKRGTVGVLRGGEEVGVRGAKVGSDFTRRHLLKVCVHAF